MSLFVSYTVCFKSILSDVSIAIQDFLFFHGIPVFIPYFQSDYIFQSEMSLQVVYSVCVCVCVCVYPVFIFIQHRYMSFEWNTQSITTKVMIGNYVLIFILLIVSCLLLKNVSYPMCFNMNTSSVAMEYKSIRQKKYHIEYFAYFYNLLGDITQVHS